MRLRESKVLAPDGRPVYLATPAYEGGGTGRRFAGFNAPNVGPNAALLGSRSTLVARARALRRNNPFIRKAIQSRVANFIGTGIQPQSLIRDNPKLKQAIERLWFDWVDEADADGRTTFYGLQMTAARELFVAGEVFIRLRPRRAEDGLTVPLQIQLLQGEHCPVDKNETLPNGNTVRAGIEFNGIGKRVAYHMHRTHPSDNFMARSLSDMDLVRVPAEQVLHVYDPIEPGQLRGEPGFVSVMLRAHDKDSYDDGTLQRLVVSTLQSAFVTQIDVGATGSPLGEFDTNNAEPEWLPGGVTYLNQGEAVTFSNPPDVGANYADFQKEMSMACAAGCDVPYEQYTGDLSQVDFSSIRAGIVEFRTQCRMLQHAVMVPQMCLPIWKEWMRLGVLTGALSIPGFAKNPREFTRVEWIPAGWPWVQPEREIAAAKESVRAGFASKRSIIREQGSYPDAVEREIGEEREEDRKAGRIHDTDPATDALTKGTGAQTADAPAEDEQVPSKRKRARNGTSRKVAASA